MFGGLPIWWILGVADVIWVPMAAAMLFYLHRSGNLRAPRRLGVWLLFLAVAGASMTMVATFGDVIGFLRDYSMYLTGTVLLLYVYRARRTLTARYVSGVLSVWWTATVVGGYAGVLRPGVVIGTPISALLPDGLVVDDLVIRRLAQIDADSLLHSTSWPNASLLHTSHWGSVFSLLLPFVVFYLFQVRHERRFIALVLMLPISVAPALVLDRGLFPIVGLAILYVAILFVAIRHVATLGRLRALTVLTLIGLLAAVLTPPINRPVTPQPPAPPAPSVATPAPTRWTLDMSEDFDTLAPTRWNIKDNTSSSNEDSYLLAGNTSVSDGVLRIQGKLESVGGRNYTSGYVDTIGKYSVPSYFRAEVRAKVPFEQGLWAAPLWFRPTDFGGGEMDLVETYGRDRANPIFHQTIHTDYGPGHRKVSITNPFSAVGSAAATEWHTYTMEKVPGRLTMWVDGVKTAEFAPGKPAWYNQYYETNRRWNLRVNLQIGGRWGGLPDSTTNWSADTSAMLVDYIKTWIPS